MATPGGHAEPGLVDPTELFSHHAGTQPETRELEAVEAWITEKLETALRTAPEEEANRTRSELAWVAATAGYWNVLNETVREELYFSHYETCRAIHDAIEPYTVEEKGAVVPHMPNRLLRMALCGTVPRTVCPRAHRESVEPRQALGAARNNARRQAQTDFQVHAHFLGCVLRNPMDYYGDAPCWCGPAPPVAFALQYAGRDASPMAAKTAFVASLASPDNVEVFKGFSEEPEDGTWRAAYRRARAAWWFLLTGADPAEVGARAPRMESWLFAADMCRWITQDALADPPSPAAAASASILAHLRDDPRIEAAVAKDRRGACSANTPLAFIFAAVDRTREVVFAREMMTSKSASPMLSLTGE